MPLITKQQELARQAELQRLREDLDFARTAGSSQGFFELYFKSLPDARTNKEAFEQLNEKYYEVFGEYKYQNLNSFKKVLSRYLKK